jgi:cyclopropane fatty-acyl-phospholipid synthase-like methyltransferase
VCTKPPLSIRITRWINRQAASPRGLFGRILAAIWGRAHARLVAELLDELDVRPGQRVLEIGSGPGDALREAVRRARGGQVVGVDVSELMVRLARTRNRHAIVRGEVDVRLEDVASLSLEVASFDRIFSIHSIYFWRGVEDVVAKLGAALRKDGRLVLAFLPEGDDIPVRLRDPTTYRFPRIDELTAAVERAGLAVGRTTPSATSPGVIIVTAIRG